MRDQLKPTGTAPSAAVETSNTNPPVVAKTKRRRATSTNKPEGGTPSAQILQLPRAEEKAPETNIKLPDGYTLQTSEVPPVLVETMMCVNRSAFRMLGRRNTCITSSYALAEFVQLFGYRSKVLRVTASARPKGFPGYFYSLGRWTSCGPKAEPGLWRGHVAVLVNDRWLLDPTLDQINDRPIKLRPVAFELVSLDPKGPRTYLDVDGHLVDYQVYPNQKGFAHAPAANKYMCRELMLAAFWRFERRRLALEAQQSKLSNGEKSLAA
ncbi:MAG: hypothetical protein U1F98_13335 [Verrucomicrobiota bacterium]